MQRRLESLVSDVGSAASR